MKPEYLKVASHHMSSIADCKDKRGYEFVCYVGGVQCAGRTVC